MTSIHATTNGLTLPVNSYISTFLEYGLTQNLTLGFDIGHSVSGNSKTIGFARYPLWISTEKSKLALELGFGQIAGEVVIRPGLSYGRGLSHKNSSGWVSADLTFEHYFSLGHTDIKLDATYGRNLAKGWKSMLQIQAGKKFGDPSFLRLVPTLAAPFGQKTHIEFGGSVGLSGPLEYGLKLGVWRSY